MRQASAFTWTAIAALLLDMASRDLSGIDGVFGVSSGGWTVICFASGIVIAIGGAVFHTMKRGPDD